MTRSADDKRARFLEAQQHSPDVPATTTRPVRVQGRASANGALTVAAGRVVDFPLRELHLFAGAGGGILGGMLLGHTPVCAVELDVYCRKVLKARQRDGWLPDFPIYEDVRQFDGKPWRGKVDVVAGGFPCQPWSQAGKRKGADDPRHLWPEMARIVEEVRPRYVFAENVQLAAFEEPWRDLRGLGYRVPPALCVAAADVGAPHLRKRWWMLAYADSQRRDRGRASREAGGPEPSDGSGAQPADTDPNSGRCQERAQRDLEPSAGQSAQQRDDALRHGARSWWQAEPAVGRVVDELAHRVDRLRALGNGQVPMAAATAWQHLIQQL